MTQIAVFNGIPIDSATLAARGYLIELTGTDTTTLPNFMAQVWAIYLEAIVAKNAAASMLSGTSVTSNTIGVGTKNFVASVGKGWAAGSTLVAFSNAAPTNAMYGRNSMLEFPAQARQWLKHNS